MDILKTSDNLRVFKKDLSEFGQILSVELSPYVLSQDLVLVGFEDKVLLCHLKIDDVLSIEILAEFKHDASRCTTLTISPETSISILPNKIIFATAGGDFKLRIFNSDLKGDDTCQVLNGHTSYINDIKFDPDNSYLVSVSDDHSAKLWSTDNFNCIDTLQLSSPGISTCWHKEDNSKLLVAEKNGLIRFYNVETRTPIMSLDYGKPLSSAHWAPLDPQLIVSLQLGELLIWDLSKPCVPVSSSLIFTESGGQIRFSPFGELVAAVNNLEGTVKVIHYKTHQLKLSASVTLPSNVAWHCRCPIVCVGDYKTLTFWRVTSK